MRIATRLMLAVALLLAMVLTGATPTTAQEEAGSAVTVSGTGDFADLKVTVSQTKNLINQTIRVSWTGGTPTELRGQVAAGANFLQIMQCWGDDSNGPDRTQCQFGENRGARPETGNAVRSRGEVDTRTEGELPASGGFGNYVPFWPFDRPRPTTLTADQTTPFYDAQLTNEVGAAITRADGTGQVDFEAQTLRQAAGLGCGTPVVETTAVRPCWLVVIPRGTANADGTRPDPGPIEGTPLDLRVWKDRIVVRLDFLPQRDACPFGVERPVTGHEIVTDAVTRWQPALCADGGTLYGYTQQTDELIRNQLVGSQPGLAIVSDPVPPDRLQQERPLVYAPVTVSGLTFAFNIMVNAKAPPEDPRTALKGRQFTDLNLTPRLVAKLLTQSYRGAMARGGAAVAEGTSVPARPARLPDNPVDMQSDPEFLKFNPDFLADDATLPSRSLLTELYIDPLVQSTTSDLTGLLWEWVLADTEAREFVNGTKDEWGMSVNEANKGLELPLDTYPRKDQLCVPVAVPNSADTKPFCPLDDSPFFGDMSASGRAASRGDTGSRIPQVTDDRGILSFPRDSLQPVDERAMMAVVDAATAERYRLPTAKLRNAAGQFVAPDAAGLGGGLAAMTPSAVDGVLQPNPASVDAAAYPLTSVSYAATSPPTLDEAAAREYAEFLRYAAGPGQVPGDGPGQLPFGYLPMPEPLRAQTLAAATTIEKRGVVAAAPENTSPLGPGATLNASGPRGSGGTSVGGVTRSGSTAAGSSGSGTTGLPQAGGTAPPASTGSPAVGAPAAPATAAAVQPVAATQPTPALPAPPVGGLLVALLIGGGLAAAAAPVTHLIGQRRGAQANHPKRPMS